MHGVPASFVESVVAGFLLTPTRLEREQAYFAHSGVLMLGLHLTSLHLSGATHGSPVRKSHRLPPNGHGPGPCSLWSSSASQ